jgi:protein-tyrosine phosphatase
MLPLFPAMVDLHHHLLPGLDDGSPDLDTSIAMARMATADGITHVVCTPHASSHWTFEPAVNATRIDELRAALAAESITLTLGSGCDFHLSFDNIQDAYAHPARYTINHKNYLLVELPDFGIARGMGENLYELQLAGMTPILTHPERNPTLQREPDRLTNWLRNGLLIQVTTSSILGAMGKEAERMAHQLLANRWVHFLATDAHNLTSRPPRMREACDLVARKYGQAYADLLCTANPTAAFAGNPLPEQPTPLNLFDDPANDTALPWWKRLFRSRV